MASELVLLTGATGHVGFRTLVFCLRQGFRVRVVLRAAAQEERILRASSIQPFAAQLEFVLIPDLGLSGAFDAALDGVSYVIHAAAPIASVKPSTIGADLTAHYLESTQTQALYLLRSAKSWPNIKRIVFTSSVVAIIDVVTDTDETMHTESTRAVNIAQPPYRSPGEAYTAAKASTLNMCEQWARTEKPHFDLLHIAPGHVFGANELVTDPQEMLLAGSNRIILQPITGKDYISEPGTPVHLDDVATAHVRALHPSVPGNRLLILSSDGVEGCRLDECFDIVAREFPEHVGTTLANNGSLPTRLMKIDCSESLRILGMDLIPYEKQVRDTVAYYLDCVRRQSPK